MPHGIVVGFSVISHGYQKKYNLGDILEKNKVLCLIRVDAAQKYLPLFLLKELELYREHFENRFGNVFIPLWFSFKKNSIIKHSHIFTLKNAWN